MPLVWKWIGMGGGVVWGEGGMSRTETSGGHNLDLVKIHFIKSET